MQKKNHIRMVALVLLILALSVGSVSAQDGYPPPDENGTAAPTEVQETAGPETEVPSTGEPGTEVPGTDVPGTEEPQPTPGFPEPGPGGGFPPVTGYEPGGYSVGPAVQPGMLDLPVDLEIALVRVAQGFQDPVNVVSANDGSGRLFVVERGGVVRVVDSSGQILPDPFLDISDLTLSAFLEQGFYDLEFHPDFASNGLLYVHFAELLRNGDGLIVEFQVSADNANVVDPESARVILRIEQPYANHNGGELEFGPDGYLYIGKGDGGWEGDPLEAGQDLSTLLGKVLRIDVNSTDGSLPYAIPDDNPLVQEERIVELFGITELEFSQIHPNARQEIWAYGLRNPWKFQFDPQNGDLYLPDVGQNHWEEINFVPAGSAGGINFGWDFLMGTRCFPIDLASCDRVGQLPIAEYSHDLGNAIVGIGVYRGSAFPDMDGVYFVGDWGSGRIWGLDQASENQWAFEELLDTDLFITGAGQDENGDLYVTSSTGSYDEADVSTLTGDLWRIMPVDQVPEGADVITGPGQLPGEATPTPEVTPTGEVTGTPGMTMTPEATVSP
ncbi:MAG TPA: PQQ-dependent sugar dehydrogenase, partial [Anaerolineaceae bacterium]|nr:PQQ-dependent sugar dehydrogenase [Anaerolineaceae bacterium]